MSAASNKGRARLVSRLGGAALAAIVLAVVSQWNFAADADDPDVGGLVIPGFESRAADAGLVMVTTREESYHIARDPEGWVLTEKGRYPVEAEPLGQLAEALSAMRFGRSMTQDPKKHDRLGLGDPLEGGTGALLEVSDGSGTILAKLIVGFKNGSAFVRRPGEDQAWEVTDAELPPFQRAAQWLDLDVVSLEATEISLVEIEPAVGRAFALVPRIDTPGEFQLAPPDDTARLTTSFAPNPPANILTRLAPIDVKPLSQLSTETPVGVHRTHTYDGLVYEAALYENGGTFWIALGVYAEEDDPDLLARIETLEERIAGWAFGVSRLEWDALTTPFEAIALAD